MFLFVLFFFFHPCGLCLLETFFYKGFAPPTRLYEETVCNLKSGLICSFFTVATGVRARESYEDKGYCWSGVGPGFAIL